MDFQTLGVLLYRTREKKHLSLLDVCSGICSQSTLSRVEQGSRELDSLTSEMLLGRIGREVTRFELILNAEDYYLNQLRIEINENIEEKNLLYHRLIRKFQKKKLIYTDNICQQREKYMNNFAVIWSAGY